jgi:hypothetical protein
MPPLAPLSGSRLRSADRYQGQVEDVIGSVELVNVSGYRDVNWNDLGSQLPLTFVASRQHSRLKSGIVAQQPYEVAFTSRNVVRELRLDRGLLWAFVASS